MTDDAAQAPDFASMSRLKLWALASRPKTLTAAFVPVAVGTALAFAHGRAQPLAALAALLGAFFIQIGTNFANDLFDFRKGADTAERLGPMRVTSSGLVSQRQIAAATVIAFALAMLCGVYLVWLAGWPLVAVGLVSIACGVAYTGGPFPLAYNALGDVFVFIFFGLVAVAGTYYVQALTVDPAAWVIAPHVGATGTAILVVNNLRDVDTDRKVGKNTLAVVLGKRFSRIQYIALLVLAFAIAPVAVALGYGTWTWLAPLLAIPMAVSLVRSIYREEGRALNAVLAKTAKFQLICGVLFALGIALSSLTGGVTPAANPADAPEAAASAAAVSDAPPAARTQEAP